MSEKMFERMERRIGGVGIVEVSCEYESALAPKTNDFMPDEFERINEIYTLSVKSLEEGGSEHTTVQFSGAALESLVDLYERMQPRNAAGHIR